VAKVPEGVDVNTAGGVPLVGLTAWQSLQNANPKPGQRVLVMAASGGGRAWVGGCARIQYHLNRLGMPSRFSVLLNSS
jgi:D-arabinose 1-dehydrogenase-like Zn-dependent alcohol dehydrogenase